jgi:hypothetical protein
MPLPWQRERAASIQRKVAIASHDGAAEVIADGARWIIARPCSHFFEISHMHQLRCQVHCVPAMSSGTRALPGEGRQNTFKVLQQLPILPLQRLYFA